MSKTYNMFETEAGCSDKDSNAESDDSGTSENLSFVVDDSKSLTVYDSDEYFKDTDDDISNNSKLVTPVAVKKGPGRPKKNNVTPLAKKTTSSTESESDDVVKKPVSSARSKNSKPELKPVGHISYPINCFSLTISKIGGDVPTNLLDIVKVWMEAHCTRGGISLESGARAHNLHVQGVLEMMYGKSKQHQRALVKIIRDLIPDRGTGYKVSCKPFEKHQQFTTMIGYITKDSNRAHFQMRLHNVTLDVLNDGQIMHSALKTSYNENKITLTTRNVIAEAFRFIKRCVSPIIIPFHFALLYMIQCSEYIFSPDFVSVYKKMHLEEAAALWSMIFFPTNTTMEMVKCLIFDSRSWAPDERKRFYDDYFHLPPSSRDSNNFQPSPSTPDAGNRANALVLLCRNKNITKTKNPQHLTDDFIPLPEMLIDEDTYSLPNDDQRRICPPTWAQMIIIVSQTRRSIEINQRQYSSPEEQHSGAINLTSSNNNSLSASMSSSTEDVQYIRTDSNPSMNDNQDRSLIDTNGKHFNITNIKKGLSTYELKNRVESNIPPYSDMPGFEEYFQNHVSAKTSTSRIGI